MHGARGEGGGTSHVGFCKLRFTLWCPTIGIVSNTKDNVPTVATKPSVPSPSRRDVTSVDKVLGPPELRIVRWSRQSTDTGFDVFCGKRGAPGTYFVGRTRLAGASSLLDDGATLNVSPPRGVCLSTYDVWSIAMNDCGALCVRPATAQAGAAPASIDTGNPGLEPLQPEPELASAASGAQASAQVDNPQASTIAFGRVPLDNDVVGVDVVDLSVDSDGTVSPLA